MTQISSPPTPSGAFWQRFRDLGALRRATDRRAVAGVAEGLSRHFDVDPIIVRVLFAALTFFGGAGLILYVALWLTVPSDASGQSVISGRLRRDPVAWTTIGLATGGIFAAAAMLGSISWAMPHPFPFLLIALIVVLGVVAVTRRGDRAPRSIAPDAPPMPPPSGSAPSWSPPSAWAPTPAGQEPAPPVGATARPDVATPTPSTTAPTTDVGPLRQPDAPTAITAFIPPEPSPQNPYLAQDTATEIRPVLDTRAWWQRDDLPPAGHPVPPFAVQPPPPPRRPRSHLFGLTMACVAIAEAAVWVVDAAWSYDVNPSVYPGTALGVIAVALLAGTWWGRSRGLIAMGVLASLLTAGAAFAGPGPYGDEGATPRVASALQPSYRMGIGRFTLNLAQVQDIEELQDRQVSIDQRFGQLRVVIPSSVTAVVDATVDHGSIDGAPRAVELDRGGEFVHVLLNPDPLGRPTVTLHLHVAYGNIRIERVVCADTPLAQGASPFARQEGRSYAAAACN